MSVIVTRGKIFKARQESKPTKPINLPDGSGR